MSITKPEPIWGKGFTIVLTVSYFILMISFFLVLTIEKEPKQTHGYEEILEYEVYQSKKHPVVMGEYADSLSMAIRTLKKLTQTYSYPEEQMIIANNDTMFVWIAESRGFPTSERKYTLLTVKLFFETEK